MRFFKSFQTSRTAPTVLEVEGYGFIAEPAWNNDVQNLQSENDATSGINSDADARSLVTRYPVDVTVGDNSRGEMWVTGPRLFRFARQFRSLTFNAKSSLYRGAVLDIIVLEDPAEDLAVLERKETLTVQSLTQGTAIEVQQGAFDSSKWTIAVQPTWRALQLYFSGDPQDVDVYVKGMGSTFFWARTIPSPVGGDGTWADFSWVDFPATHIYLRTTNVDTHVEIDVLQSEPATYLSTNVPS